MPRSTLVPLPRHVFPVSHGGPITPARSTTGETNGSRLPAIDSLRSGVGFGVEGGAAVAGVFFTAFTTGLPNGVAGLICAGFFAMIGAFGCAAGLVGAAAGLSAG